MFVCLFVLYVCNTGLLGNTCFSFLYSWACPAAQWVSLSLGVWNPHCGCTHTWCKSTGPESLLTAAAPESLLLSTGPESFPLAQSSGSCSSSTPLPSDSPCSPQWRAPPVTFIFLGFQRQFIQLPPHVMPFLSGGTCLLVSVFFLIQLI